MRSLYVAAGGGGDGIAALAVARALADQGTTAIATYSWDRYVLDPEPGPRRADDFEHLTEHAPGCLEVTSRTRLRSGAQSTLTMGARQTDARWFLLDPEGGARGVAEQLAAIVAATGASVLTAVDVGGDVLAHGDEPSLRSPLADSLTLAALTLVGGPTQMVVAGPGLDGELSTRLVADRCVRIGAARLLLDQSHTAPDLALLQIHPSEATVLLTAAVAGIRGRAEIRDDAIPVELTSASASAYLTTADACLSENGLAEALQRTTSLAEAEAVTVSICGRSELAYERRKAADADRARAAEVGDDELLARIHAYTPAALERGSDLATFRRLTDALGLPRYDPSRLRRALTVAADPRLPLFWLSRFAAPE